MPYPCNFDSTAFAVAYGDEDYDRRQEGIAEDEAHDDAQARKVVAILTAAAKDIEAMNFRRRFPFAGFDQADVVAQLRDIVDVLEVA